MCPVKFFFIIILLGLPFVAIYAADVIQPQIPEQTPEQQADAMHGPVNLVANASFDMADEQGAAANWIPETAGMTTVSLTRDTEIKRTGDASGRITISSDYNPGWPAYSCILPVEAGQYFNVSAWTRTLDVKRIAYIATDFLDAAGQRISFASSSQAGGTTTDWKQISLIAQIPAGTVTMAVRLILYGSGTVWFDDVSVVHNEVYESAFARLKESLPAEMVERATTMGDLSRVYRLFQQAAEGGKYTVGVIGGSITAGGVTSGVETRYAAYILNWFKEHFPKAEWDLVNAGIGATGTNYGCLRAQRDLLSKEPDFVITEYAVNDADNQECAETYEGLLRQILANPKQPPVLMLFMMNRIGGNAQEWQSKLGLHYNLPMLSYRDMLWPEIEAGRMTWSEISPDEVHPHDVGHGYAGKLVSSLLDYALANIPAEPVVASAIELPEPLLTDVYQFTTLAEANDLQPVVNDGWTYDETHDWAKAWVATVPGSVLEFDVTGEQLFVSYYRFHGPMGRASITIDDGEPSIQEAWFEQTWGGYRHMIKLPTGGPGKHHVRLELLEEKHPESAGNEFRLLCLGTAGQ